MTEVAPRSQGLRAMLGFGRKEKTSTRKVLKKNGQREQAFSDIPPEDPERQSSFDFFGSPLHSPRGLSASESYSLMPQTEKSLESTTPRNASVSSSSRAAPRKLSKLPPQIPERMDDVLDKDTGERKDITDMMHAFTYREEEDDIKEAELEDVLQYDPARLDGAMLLARASPELWMLISNYLTPLDVANLSSTCRTMYYRLGDLPYNLLRDPANRTYRLEFLLAMDSKLPEYLFCFPCAQWHLRTHPGQEVLKPPLVLNPVFRCPNSTNVLIPPPRLRISEGRALPFTFLQLAKRHWSYGPAYGIPVKSLARRWKDPYSPWSHESTYHIQSNGHVLMRIKSQVFVEAGMPPAAKRLLLFSRADYIPYFSVCAHWQKGILTSIPKCALDHIPVPKVNMVNQLRTHMHTNRAPGPIALCMKCQPMRRCTECPSEYIFELKLVEDRSVKVLGPERFKQALLVTRWSDLGPARSTDDREWAAMTGQEGAERYDSFKEIGKRGISGVFESAFTDTLPGQRILSMDPEKKKRERRGIIDLSPSPDDADSWY